MEPSVNHRMTELERSTKPRTIGVVFVHGVGEQKQSSTIREQGGPILDWIWGWHNARNLAGDSVLQPQWAKLSYGAPLTGPARFSVHLPAYDRDAYPNESPGRKHWDAATWVLAEGWWASRLEAPSMVTMLTWSLRILGRFWFGLYNESIRRTRDRAAYPSAGGARLGRPRAGGGLGHRRVGQALHRGDGRNDFHAANLAAR